MLEISRKELSRSTSIELFNLVVDEIREPDPEKANFLFINIENFYLNLLNLIAYKSPLSCSLITSL